MTDIFGRPPPEPWPEPTPTVQTPPNPPLDLLDPMRGAAEGLSPDEENL
jgi:hypothetical protein